MTNQEAIETIKANYPPENYSMLREALDIALALLKEQEAVEPKIVSSAKGIFYTCGTCGLGLVEVRDTVSFDDRKRIRFCTWCGRKVKWE